MTVTVLVLTKLVGMGLRDTVKLRDLDRVKETVTEMVMLPVLVATRVVGAGEGERVKVPVTLPVKEVRPEVAKGLGERVTERVRVAVTLPVKEARPEVAKGLGERVTERVRVPVTLPLREVTPEVARGLGESVPVTEMVMLPVPEAGAEARCEGERDRVGVIEPVYGAVVARGERVGDRNALLELLGSVEGEGGTLGVARPVRDCDT